jgi:DNA invertase Pin-like site-specific DNA recombinase
MSAIYEAHLRLLASLPVRTHERRDPPPNPNIYSTNPREKAHDRRRRIRILLAQGVDKPRIRILLGISRATLFRHQRAIKRGK